MTILRSKAELKKKEKKQAVLALVGNIWVVGKFLDQNS